MALAQAAKENALPSMRTFAHQETVLEKSEIVNMTLIGKMVGTNRMRVPPLQQNLLAPSIGAVQDALL